MPTLLLALALIAQDPNATTLSGHAGDVTQLAFSPDGKTLASSGADFTIRIWDLAAEKEATTLTDLKLAPEALAFSPDGKLLAAGLHSKIQLWQVPEGNRAASLEPHFSPIARLAFAIDGKTLLAGGQTGQVEVLDAAEAKLIHSLRTGQTLPEFSADGKVVAVPQLQQFPFKDPATGRKIAAPTVQCVRFWDPITGKNLRTLDVAAGAIALSPDGRKIAIVGPTGGRLLDSETGKEEGLLATGANRPIGAPQFSADGKTICTPLLNGESVILWDAATLKERRVVETPGRRQSKVSISPDGKALAWAVGRDIKLWRESADSREPR